MGQLSLILVLAGLLTGSVLLWNAQVATQEAQATTARYHEDQFGREVAEVGLERVRRRLAAKPDTWDTLATVSGTTFFNLGSTIYETDIEHGTYAVTVKNYTGSEPAPFPLSVAAPERVDVVATGEFREKTYTIRATYEKDWVPIKVPPAYRYAMMSGGDLMLFAGGGFGGVQSADDVTNADVHANGDLNVGDGSLVRGYGTWVQNGYVNSDNFAPLLSAGGGTYAGEGSSIPIPPFEPVPYLSAPLGPPDENVVFPFSVIDSGTTVTWGNPTRDRDDPYIVYVSGNLTLNGRLRLEGNVIVVVTGNLSVGNTAEVTATSTGRPSVDASDAAWRNWIALNVNSDSSTRIFWLVNGNVTLNNTLAMVGRVFTNGDFTLTGGGGNLAGGVTARGHILVSGSSDHRHVWYTRVSPGPGLPGGNYLVPAGPRLVTYSAWPSSD